MYPLLMPDNISVVVYLRNEGEDQMKLSWSICMWFYIKQNLYVWATYQILHAHVYDKYCSHATRTNTLGEILFVWDWKPGKCEHQLKRESFIWVDAKAGQIILWF